MRGFIIGVLIIINYILQSTLFQAFRIGGVVPNTTLILIISLAVQTDKIQGAVIGLAAGLLQDILLGRAIGLNGILFMVIGYTIGYINKNIFKDSFFIPMFLTALSTLAYELVNIFLIFVMGYEVDPIGFLRNSLWIQMIYNSIVSMIVYFYVSKLFRSQLMKK